MFGGWNPANINRSCTFELNGFNETVNGISTPTAGPLDNCIRNTASNASTLTVGDGDTSSSYGGTITDGGAGKTLALTKIGAGTLTLSGLNTYVGPTIVNGGTLALTVGALLTNSAVIIVASNAMLDVSGLSTTFTLAQMLGSQTLSNSAPGAILNGTNNCSAGTLSLVTDGVNPAFVQTNGTMTLSAATVILVNNTGATLAAGTYPLIAAAPTGNPGKVTGTVPSVVISGNGAAAATTLQINGAGGLDLVVASTTSNNPTTINFSFNGGSLTLTWPPDHLGWIVQSNSLDLGNPSNWYSILSSQTTTNFVVPINPATPPVYFRLRSPF